MIMEIKHATQQGIATETLHHYPTGTVITIDNRWLSPKHHFDLLMSNSIRLDGIAGRWEIYKRYGARCELKRIRHGNWCISFQYRRGHPLPGADPTHWESWRVFSVWPMRFSSVTEAEDYIHYCGTFMNLHDKRKVSMSATNTGALMHMNKRGTAHAQA